MYDPVLITDFIADNVRKTRNPFGVPKTVLNTWQWGERLPAGGDAILFTGLMYQFMPYIETTTAYLEAYEDTDLAQKIQSHPAVRNFPRYGDFVPNFLGGAGLSVFVRMKAAKEKRRTDQVLKDIVSLLRRSGVDVGYRPDLDEYSGILLYDLGDQENFVRHARKTARKLQAAGVKKLITVDPHTTYALKVLYPKYTGISFDVAPYFQHLRLSPINGGQEVALHDPCFYGRYLEMSDAPRSVLSDVNIGCREVRNRGAFTHCCGGPAESVSPKLSNEIMERRAAELRETGAPIVAMCPICHGNLKKSGADVHDLSTLLAAGAQS